MENRTKIKSPAFVELFTDRGHPGPKFLTPVRNRGFVPGRSEVVQPHWYRGYKYTLNICTELGC